MHGLGCYNEIIATLCELKTSPTPLVHVLKAAHQDDCIPYDALSLDAQLHVDTDAEAGYYQCMFPRQQPIIPQLPSNPIQLYLLGPVICSKLETCIHEAFTVPPYLHYLETQFHWTPQVTATIDWTVYTQAIGCFQMQRIQIAKLCNDLLPMAPWANQYYPLTLDHCLH
jgi:hypothetical protein